MLNKAGTESWNKLDEFWYQKIYINNTGRPVYSYHYERKSAKPSVVIEFDVPRFNHLGAYKLLEKDLRDSLGFLKILSAVFDKNDEKDMLLVKALTRAVVITYGKCFVSTTGRKVKLEKDIVSLKNKILHESIMNMRHNYVAHAGVSEYEACKLVLVLPPEKKVKQGKTVRLASFFELAQVTASGDVLLNFEGLIKEVHEYTIRKVEEASSGLDKISPMFFYEMVSKSKKARIVITEADLEGLI